MNTHQILISDIQFHRHFGSQALGGMLETQVGIRQNSQEQRLYLM